MCHGFITQMTPFLCTKNWHLHHIGTYRTLPWLVPNPCVEVVITDFAKAIHFLHISLAVGWRGYNFPSWVVALARRNIGVCAGTSPGAFAI